MTAVADVLLAIVCINEGRINALMDVVHTARAG